MKTSPGEPDSPDAEKNLPSKPPGNKARGRGSIHRVPRGGVPRKNLESRPPGTPEFHKLIPEHEPIPCVHGLPQEVASLGSSGTAKEPGHLDPGLRSQAMAQRYIQENFEPEDWLAVVMRNRHSEETLQRISTARQIASPEFQSWLRHKNVHGSDIYLSLNTLKEHANGRTKADLKDIRHLYVDLDKMGNKGWPQFTRTLACLIRIMCCRRLQENIKWSGA